MTVEPQTPEQLRLMLERRGRLQVEIKTLQKRLEDEEHNRRLGSADADAEIEKIRASLAPLQQKLNDLGQSISVQQAEHKIRMDDYASAKEFDKIAEISSLAAERIMLAKSIEEKLRTVGEEINRWFDAGRELGLVIGTAEAQRLMRRSASQLRLLLAVTTSLQIKAEVGERNASGIPDLIFPYPYPMTGQANYEASLEQREKEVIDMIVDVYSTRQAAAAARDRIDPSGMQLHVVPEGPLGQQYFRLKRGELRGRDKGDGK